MEIVDAQIHLFGPDAKERARRIGQEVIDAAGVIDAMDQAGVSRAYLVPAGSAANEECLEAARRWPARFRVMGIPSLNKPEARAAVARWHELGYTGARLSFPPFRAPSWLRDGTADWFWPAAEEQRIPVMIWAPEQLAEVGEVARRHPDLKIAVDHLGLFVEDKGTAAVSAVIKELLPLAGHPNVAVKASALPAHSAEEFPYRDLHQPLRDVLAAFGPDRVFWGTDLTRLPCSLSSAVRMFTENLGFLSGAELDQVMGEAVVNWIGW
ncbi:MAG TPA: amidohydrolase family protein [Trebonia sp.]|jgi:predicted TIM-barrel fold metal-dependent hydrolase|nr:amidohydrolase family protein [Trebonia sp.]